MSVLFGVLQRLSCNAHRIGAAIDGKHRHADALADHLQLLDGCRAVNVAGSEQRPFALFFVHERKLAGVRGLAGALKTGHHDDGRRLGRNDKLGVFAAHESGQLFVDDFDNLLGRNEAFKHIAADRAFGGGLDEILDDLVVDVGLQKRKLDLAHALSDIGFSQFPFIFEGFEGV